MQPGVLSSLRLRGLDLSGHQGGGTAGARALSSLMGRVPLMLLDLKNVHLTDSAALALAPGLAGCTCLVALNLSRTDDVCASLHSCSCGITKKSAFALCASLQALPALQELDLSRQALGDEGTSAIAPLLARSRTLTALLLADNGIGEAGSLSLASAIATTSAPLADLSVSDNPMGDVGFAALLQALMGRAASPPTRRR